MELRPPAKRIARPGPGPALNQKIKRLGGIHWSDLAFSGGLKVLAMGVVGLFLGVLFFLLNSSLEAFQKLGVSFFFSSHWSPVRDSYGVLAFTYGTLVSSLIAILIALPIGVSSALFLTEISPRILSQPLRFLIEMLAAIPSVVYGLWGIFVLAPFVRYYVQPLLGGFFPSWSLFQGPPFGVGLFTAGLVLAIMIIPTITSISCEVFRSIPRIYREGALALGATSWETIRMAVLSPGRSGVFGAVILALGRAMGETMAVTMVIGNRADISSSLFSPAATMASVIANEYAEASTSLHISSLTAVGFCLLGVSLIVNLIARVFVLRERVEM